MKKNIYVFDGNLFDENHFEIRKRLGQIMDDLNYLDKEELTIEKVSFLKDRMKKDLKESVEYLDKFNKIV